MNLIFIYPVEVQRFPTIDENINAISFVLMLNHTQKNDSTALSDLLLLVDI